MMRSQGNPRLMMTLFQLVLLTELIPEAVSFEVDDAMIVVELGNNKRAWIYSHSAYFYKKKQLHRDGDKPALIGYNADDRWTAYYKNGKRYVP